MQPLKNQVTPLIIIDIYLKQPVFTFILELPGQNRET